MKQGMRKGRRKFVAALIVLFVSFPIGVIMNWLPLLALTWLSLVFIIFAAAVEPIPADERRFSFERQRRIGLLNFGAILFFSPLFYGSPFLVSLVMFFVFQLFLSLFGMLFWGFFDFLHMGIRWGASRKKIVFALYHSFLLIEAAALFLFSLWVSSRYPQLLLLKGSSLVFTIISSVLVYAVLSSAYGGKQKSHE